MKREKPDNDIRKDKRESGGACGSTKTCYSGGSTVCSSSSYPYSSISNATMSGACTGYRSTAGGSCSGSSATYYSGFTCKSGYCKSGSACYNVCSTSSYPYSTISNATMSGACTGYTGTSASTCSGSSATRYSGFTCNSGYCKVLDSCIKTYSSCKAAGYLDSCASNCTATKQKVYNSSCGLMDCYSCTNCTAIDPIVKPGLGCSACCTGIKPYCYNNQCYSYCPAGGSQMCPMCALRDEEFIPDASCPGGAQYSTCACGGTHTARGYTGAHACTLL